MTSESLVSLTKQLSDKSSVLNSDALSSKTSNEHLKSQGNSYAEPHPPLTQLIKVNSMSGSSLVRKDKSVLSSRFSTINVKELTPLPLIKGKECACIN